MNGQPSPADYRLRPAIPCDAPAVARLLTQLGYPADETEAAARIAWVLGDENHRLMVAEGPGGVAGVLDLHRTPVLAYGYPLARITSLCVDDEARNRGIGGLLVGEAERQARDWGCRRMEVTSNIKRERAHRFYERLGFVEDRKRFVKDLHGADEGTLPPALSPGQLLAETALLAAKAAGEVMMRDFPSLARQPLAVLPHDTKLVTDLRCETAMKAVIRKRHPDHAILSEESGLEPGRGGHVWIIDPLDGTMNFAHRIPYFCASVACSESPGSATARGLLDGVVAGVVHAPLTGETFTAVRDFGAFLNGRRIAVVGPASLADAVVAVSLGSRADDTSLLVGILPRLIADTRKVRSLGAAALDLCRTAQGDFGAAIYRSLRIWDVAAASLILSESGCGLDLLADDAGQLHVLGSTPELRPTLLAMLGEAWNRPG